MSDEERRAFAEEPRFPAFGVGGDYAGARRSRRAFRMLIVACVAFTLVLYFVEEFKRYDLNETNYRRALTHHPESARSFLRSVVKREREDREKPNAKYIEYLASIEEEDKVLALYDEAYRLNSGDASLLINYGCELYRAGQYIEARERFREAGIIPPPNALPKYLEAAAMAAASPPDADPSATVALVASANNSGDPVLFPEPLWHHSLPRSGEWYSNLRRSLVQNGCWHLNSFVAQLADRAEREIEAGKLANWDSWLRQIQIMGERLVGNTTTGPEGLGSIQAIAGLHMQLDMLALRKRIVEHRGGGGNAIDVRMNAVKEALDELKAFQSKRDSRIAAHRTVIGRPWHLIGYTLGALVIVFLLAAIVAKAADPGRRTWAAEHGAICGATVTIGLGLALTALFALLFTRDLPSAAAWTSVFTWMWIASVGGLVFFGPFYPLIALPSAKRVVDLASLTPEEAEAQVAAARRFRRKACATMTRRYYGILLGGMVAVVCIWILSFRVVESIYPMEIKLLVTGLEDEEIQVVRNVQARLR